MRTCFLILVLGFAAAAHAQSKTDSLVTYKWLGPKGDAEEFTIEAQIDVPPGYTSDANQGLKNHVAAGGLKEDAPTSF